MRFISFFFIFAATIVASLVSGALIRTTNAPPPSLITKPKQFTIGKQRFTPSTIDFQPCAKGEFREGSNCVYTFVECPKYTSMCVDAWQEKKTYSIRQCARTPTKKEAYDELQEYFTPETRCRAWAPAVYK